MCKNIFAHQRRKQSIAAAGEMAVIGLYARHIGLFSVKEEKTGLDTAPGRCINKFTSALFTLGGRFERGERYRPG